MSIELDFRDLITIFANHTKSTTPKSGIDCLLGGVVAEVISVFTERDIAGRLEGRRVKNPDRAIFCVRHINAVKSRQVEYALRFFEARYAVRTLSGFKIYHLQRVVAERRDKQPLVPGIE